MDENLKKLESQVEKLGEEVGKVLEKAEGQHTEASKIAEDTKTELKGVMAEWNEAKVAMEKRQEQIDTLETQIQKQKDINDQRLVSLKDAFMELEKNEGFKSFSNDPKGKDFTLDVKADTLASTHFTAQNTVIEPDRVRQSPIYVPDRKLRMRDIIPGGRTNSMYISYPKEGTVVDGTDTVAEGAAKPQNEFPITQTESKVEKIAAFVRISDEALNDVPYMASYLSNRLISKLRNAEDTQLLYGSGVSPDLNGINTQGTAMGAGYIVTGQDWWRVLRKAIAQAQVAEYSPTAILLSPGDLGTLETQISATDSHFLMPPFTSYTNGQLFISGVPVLASSFVTANDFIVGDFFNGAQLFDRTDANVRFFEQDGSNVTTNKITVRVEERLGLAVYHTGAFIASDFTTATT